MLINRATVFSACLFIWTISACSPAPKAPDTARRGDRMWIQQGFDEFKKGSFEDGGANMYISAAGKIELINRWDFNNDGCIDLVFANSHPQAEKLDAVIYWGDGKD